jgi:hypothetical protein
VLDQRNGLGQISPEPLLQPEKKLPALQIQLEKFDGKLYGTIIPPAKRMNLLYAANAKIK